MNFLIKYIFILIFPLLLSGNTQTIKQKSSIDFTSQERAWLATHPVIT